MRRAVLRQFTVSVHFIFLSMLAVLAGSVSVGMVAATTVVCKKKNSAKQSTTANVVVTQPGPVAPEAGGTAATNDPVGEGRRDYNVQLLQNYQVHLASLH